MTLVVIPKNQGNNKVCNCIEGGELVSSDQLRLAEDL